MFGTGAFRPGLYRDTSAKSPAKTADVRRRQSRPTASWGGSPARPGCRRSDWHRDWDWTRRETHDVGHIIVTGRIREDPYCRRTYSTILRLMPHVSTQPAQPVTRSRAPISSEIVFAASGPLTCSRLPRSQMAHRHLASEEPWCGSIQAAAPVPSPGPGLEEGLPRLLLRSSAQGIFCSFF